MKRIIPMIFALLMLLTACGKSADPWQEQYDLGVRYLSEGNYEEAIIAFTAAIEIEPKRAEAYIGIADTYVNIGDYDAAKAILEQGYDTTGDGRLLEILEAYKAGNISTSDGRIFRESHYDGEGVLQSYLEYTYVDSGWMYDTVASYDGAGNQTGFVQCEYDDDGRQTVGVVNHGNRTVGKTENEFDEEGNQVYSRWYNADGTLSDTHASTYDSEGNRIEWVSYDAEGRQTQKNVFSYDDDGYRSKEIIYHYDSDGEMYNRTIREYGPNNTELRSTTYDAEGNAIYWTELVYDDAGKLVEIIDYDDYDSDGQYTTSKTVFEYDGFGQLIRMTGYGSDGAVVGVTEYS